ncbi:hypothetical protein G4B88_017109 [Cannabis sativa]|uniref:Transposase-associated domain-containing protein n=1 Tax=Cannabis sativa TaxID=3483 RepID=A0A7J6HTP7_CANSA|nr:hypothetical protein G4B88_017109 [Cannabis sativa]
MDKEWMKENKLSKEYEEGVEYFMEFAIKNGDDPNMIPCPCVMCRNFKKLSGVDVRVHLYKFGIDSSYKNWIWHGERVTRPNSSKRARREHVLDVSLVHMTFLEYIISVFWIRRPSSYSIGGLKRTSSIQSLNDSTWLFVRCSTFEDVSKQLIDQCFASISAKFFRHVSFNVETTIAMVTISYTLTCMVFSKSLDNKVTQIRQDRGMYPPWAANCSTTIYSMFEEDNKIF